MTAAGQILRIQEGIGTHATATRLAVGGLQPGNRVTLTCTVASPLSNYLDGEYVGEIEAVSEDYLPLPDLDFPIEDGPPIYERVELSVLPTGIHRGW